MILAISTLKNIFFINTDRVSYIEADDHYTNVYYDNDQHFVLPVGLSVIEKSINVCSSERCALRRFGRRYIINLQKVLHINVQRKETHLQNVHNKYYTIHLTKIPLKEVMGLVKERYMGKPSAI